LLSVSLAGLFDSSRTPPYRDAINRVSIRRTNSSNPF